MQAWQAQKPRPLSVGIVAQQIEYMDDDKN